MIKLLKSATTFFSQPAIGFDMDNEDADIARYISLELPVDHLIEQCHRAIALSLQETTKKRAVITIDSDDDDDIEEIQFQEQLTRALEASKSALPSQTRASSLASSSTLTTQQDNGSGVSAFLSERAQMERERRERQKRLRPESNNSTAAQTEGEDSEDEGPPAKRHQVSSSSSSYMRPNATASSSKMSNSVRVQSNDHIFWNGELRQTATRHAEPRADGLPTFRLTDVLGKVS